jgi:hypothetical protein
MPNNTVNLLAFHMNLDKNRNYNTNHSDLGKIIKIGKGSQLGINLSIQTKKGREKSFAKVCLIVLNMSYLYLCILPEGNTVGRQTILYSFMMETLK